mgnify:CR=1 FL=1
MSVFDDVRALVAEKLSLDPSAITDSSSFIEDLNADSLDLADLMMAVEDKFGVTFEDADAENFKTVGDLVRALEAKKSA